MNRQSAKLIKNVPLGLQPKHPALLITHFVLKVLLFKLHALMVTKEQQEVPLLYVLNAQVGITAVLGPRSTAQEDIIAQLEVQLQHRVQLESIMAI